ncbi:hypothetical protein TUM4438_01680 [Shewanella sairae]|uniref:Uncharacterized protein n=1 Tax=Shewanella sairae TaxID=190310 RepID=A0ABQ4P094_9GAMM|nr:hypothetical protein [Shewanella sairae]MCL1129170.1 hypothetical protein [Shewanella sairae]GIU40459.1 hypothetical protein TUM4438_01680 [Shewanella sairae]
MNEFSEIFSQGYWWLSLLGGLHCLGLGLYIRYIYNERSGNHKLLGSIFSLMALYFFTGLLTNDNAPAPIHLLFILIIPVYFLMMPLLYLYCKRSLNEINHPIGFSRHFYPAIIVAVLVLATSGLRLIFGHHWPKFELEQLSKLTDLHLLSMLLPALLFIQTGWYFFYIIKMLSRYPGRAARVHQNTLKDIKFRWLLVLTLALMSNWLIRTVLIIIPFYFGETMLVINQAATTLTLLLTVYLLAIYGLKQITRAAFLRGKLAQISPQKTPMQASQQLLSSEELAYLHQLMKEDEQSKESKQ